MPYGISNSQSDCSNWATVKQIDDDYETITCHDSKQDAIDQMIAVSLTEDIEPLGDVSNTEEEEDDDDLMEERAVNLSPPEFMRENARKGLKYHEEGLSGDGLKPQTVEDARKMANGDVSEAKWRKIAPWIARHLVDLEAEGVSDGEITAGVVAHYLWGSGKTKEQATRAMEYAERVVSQLEEQRAPAPKKDQIFGSEKNPEGSAADKEGDIELGEATETALENKAKEHNEKMKEEDKPDWTRVRVGTLRSVWRRGAGAFSTSHRPNMTRAQWAMARVNAFLYLSEKGKPENPKYITDNDLLNKDHPKFSDSRTALYTFDNIRSTMTNTETTNWVVTDQNESRRIAFSNIEVRASEDGTKLVGYAAVFDSPSEPLPWTEFVKRGAFNKTINDGADVRLLIDHEGVPLARTTSGTLVLREDDRGLLVESDLDPSNPDAARLISALRRGDISQMSFAFRTIKDSWNTDRSVRELREVQLFDVSVVTFPAYESTVAELRARQEVVIIPTTNTLSLRRRQIQIARNKMQ
jgi:HK97 family phage prohead protease